MNEITVTNPLAFACPVQGCLCRRAGYPSEDVAARARRRHLAVKHPGYVRNAR